MCNFRIVLIVFTLAMGSSPSLSVAADGPIFGIATAPNGDLLVATGAGVVNSDTGELVQSIPGITDIAPIGKGSMWVIRGGGSDQGFTDSGQALLRVSNGQVREIVNLFQFEQENNPDLATVQSNPFDVHSLGGNAALVVDAAANNLLRIDNRGNVHVVAIFPARLASTASLKTGLGCPGSGLLPCFVPNQMPSEAVPTSIAVGPDGYYYVGELRGFPGPLGQSRIWRVAPRASWAECGVSPDCTVVFDGFTSIIDLAMGPDGLLYVAEFDDNGWFAAQRLGIQAGGTINACDIDTGTCIEVIREISYLTAIAFGKRGELYAAQDGIIPSMASIIEIP